MAPRRRCASPVHHADSERAALAPGVARMTSRNRLLEPRPATDCGRRGKLRKATTYRDMSAVARAGGRRGSSPG